MKNIFSTVLFLAGIFFNQYSFSQSNPRMQNPNYAQTKFFDNFKSLNRGVWNVKSNEIVEELYIWVDSVATVNQSNDSLNLSMLYSQNYRTTDGHTANFIAGSVETFQTYSYGVYECKANFANDQGAFPAFWLMSSMPCSTSYNNEIDIVELKREDGSPTLDNNIFYWPANCNPNSVGLGFKANPFTWGQPHTFKCIWSPSVIEYWVDNTPLHTVHNTGQTEYPHLPQRIILSQQIVKYNTSQPIYGIVTPQTSNFHWVKYREFFLAPEITCPSVICTSSPAVLDVAPAADSITWKLTPTNLFSGTKVGTGKNATITSATGASGQGKITYTFRMPSKEIFTAEKTFWVGKPGTPLTSPSGYPTLQVSLGAYQPISLTQTPGFTGGTINWWSTGSITPVGSTSGTTCTFEAVSLGTGNFYVTVQNTCPGISPVGGGTVNVVSGGGQLRLVLSPNPTSDETTLSIEPTSPETTIDESVEWDLEIYDQVQTLKEKKIKLKGREHKIQTAGWKEGVYFVRVKYKDEVLTSQLVVKQ